MLIEYNIHTSESKMLNPPSLKFAEFRYWDSIAMLFLHLLSALESECKDTKYFQYGEKK